MKQSNSPKLEEFRPLISLCPSSGLTQSALFSQNHLTGSQMNIRFAKDGILTSNFLDLKKAHIQNTIYFMVK